MLFCVQGCSLVYVVETYTRQLFQRIANTLHTFYLKSSNFIQFKTCIIRLGKVGETRVGKTSFKQVKQN